MRLKMDILDLDAIPHARDELSIQEGIRKLEENPISPEAQKFKRELLNFAKELHDKYQPVVDEIMEMPVQTALFAKKLASPEYRHRISFIKGVNLVGRIPKAGGEYKTPRKLAKLFEDRFLVDKFKFIKCLPDKRLYTKKDYMRKPKKYDTLIRNRLKYLKGIANNLGYTFRIRELTIEIVPVSKN